MRCIKIILLIFLLPNSLFSREEGANPRALSLSDAVRSCAMGISGIYFNPAGISQISQYAIELGYGYQNHINSNAFNISVVDSQTNPHLAGGLAYTYFFSEIKKEKGEKNRNGHILRGALSTAIRGEDFSLYFGSGVKYMNFDYEKENGLNAATIDAGMILNFWGQLSIAVVGQNLIDVSAKEAPTNLGAGVSFLYYPFLISFDTIFDFKTKPQTSTSFNLGTEIILKRILVIRGGFQFNKIEDNKKFSFGIGYVSRTAGVDIGYLQNIDNSDEKIIVGALKFFLPSK